MSRWEEIYGRFTRRLSSFSFMYDFQVCWDAVVLVISVGLIAQACSAARMPDWSDESFHRSRRGSGVTDDLWSIDWYADIGNGESLKQPFDSRSGQSLE